eukprot:gene12440-16685_t
MSDGAQSCHLILAHYAVEIENLALEMAGLTRSQAFEIDNHSLGMLIGEFYSYQLIELFFKKVYSDKDQSLRDLFPLEMDEHVQDLADYSIQRLGGPCFYSDRKGYPLLIQKHSHLPITPVLAEKWLYHMKCALEDMEAYIEPEDAIRILNFYRYTAYHIIAGQKCIQDEIAKGSTYS